MLGTPPRPFPVGCSGVVREPGVAAQEAPVLASLCSFDRLAVREDLVKSVPSGESRKRMNASLLAVLNDAERLLIAQTERAELAALDEDAAIEFEARIRRARNKYIGQYRRGASAAVTEHGGRGKARPENTRAAMKAEAFEQALARVSRRVAVLAQQSAAKLRAERLAAARAARQGHRPDALVATPATGQQGPALTEEPIGDRALRSPASERRRAGTRAEGARWQARRDSR